MIKNRRKSLIIFGAVFFAFYFVMSRVSRVPVIYPDEAGYMGWAYKMLYGNGDGLRYLPGYSLILAPILAVFKNIQLAFPVITAVNALLGGVFALLVLNLCFKLEKNHAVLTAVCVCLYPSYALYVDMALCETLLTMLFAILILLTGRLCENVNSMKRWIAVLMVTMLMCITHSRAIAVLPSLVLTLWFFVMRNGKKGTKAGFFGVITAMAVCASVLFMALLSKNDNVNAAHLLNQVKNLFTLSGIAAFSGTIISQLTYLIFSTYGFVLLGVYYCIAAVKKDENRGIALFSLLSFLFALMLSALFMYHHEQPNQAIYGRYTEHTLWAILMFSLTGLLKNGTKPVLAIFAVFSAVFTGAAYSSHMEGLDGNLFSNWGMYHYRMFLANFSYWNFAVLFGILAAILWLIARKNRKHGIIALCLIFVICTGYTQYDYFYKGTTLRREVPQLTSLLEKEGAVTKKGDSGDFLWDCYNYTVYNPNLIYNNEPGNLILSQKRIKGLGLLGAEKNSHTFLYSRFIDPSVTIDETDAPNGKISLLTAENGQINLNVKVLARAWLCTASAEDLTKAVRLGMRVYKEGKLLDDLRADFTDNVYIDANVSFDFPYEDGEYTVVFETIREFLYRNNPLALKITKKDGNLTYKKTREIPEIPEWSISPEFFPTAKDFYRYYVTPKGGIIEGIFLEGDLLVLETYGEAEKLQVNVKADGKHLKLREFKDNKYYFELFGSAEKLEITSETYAYCNNGMEFLTTESDWKIVDMFVRGMKKVFDIRLDHRQRGVDIKKVYTRKEQNL